jgi:tetratricopeptide (TPR) repeat protein
MSTQLRITQHTERVGHFQIEVKLEDGDLVLKGNAHVHFSLKTPEQEAIRWYFEDYLKNPLDPAPRIAEQIEDNLNEIGVRLFTSAFDSDDTVRAIWARAQKNLESVRIEIAGTLEETALVPWELMREEPEGTPLALRARSFVRTINDLPTSAYVSSLNEGPLRILLVICRPTELTGVPFRSVALRIIGSLSEHKDIQLDILRPPTFEALQERLEQASDEGCSYHIVHFDGHGTYEDPMANAAGKTSLSPRGYLHFEGKAGKGVPDILVHGTVLGQTLAATGVPLLVLNACRSAFAEPLPTPSKAISVDRERSYTSLAQEVMAAGLTGVVAMRYEVRVDTAVRFVTHLYAALAQGLPLGEAVTKSRALLAVAPQQQVAYQEMSLQDWSTPLVYEATPLYLTPLYADSISIRSAPTPELANFPAPPRAGFVGGDDTLLALERAVQSTSVVLLHGPAGSGKTATATEFAAWYVRTHGANRPAVFTSFEQYTPLDRALEILGQTFEGKMDLPAVPWAELDRDARRSAALALLGKWPLLWVWDSIEGIDGFPPGTESLWSEVEREDLCKFLQGVCRTQSKIVLTSRREESNWLGDLPRRIPVSSLRLDDFIPLASALTNFYGQPQRSVVAWWPLLETSRGNPSMATALIEQVLRDGIKDANVIAGLAERVRRGEVTLDSIGDNRARSLRASLEYGWTKESFRENWRILALLHLFQGWVNVVTVRTMGNPQQSWGLATVRDLSLEEGIAFLNQAAEAGLLLRIPVTEKANQLDGLYIAHPALPWFLKPWFDQAYPDQPTDDLATNVSMRMAAIRAFTHAVGELGEFLHQQYSRGQPSAVADLFAEHDNLRYAWEFARTHDWWDALVKIMQGLRSLYRHLGRTKDWAQLVEMTEPLLCDPATGGPLPEREEPWLVFSDYVVEMASGYRRWDEAISLQNLRLQWAERFAEAALAAPRDTLDDEQRTVIRNLAGTNSGLGSIWDKQGDPASERYFNEAIRLYQWIGDQSAEAAVAERFGLHYLRNGELDKAEQQFLHSGMLRDEKDWLGKSRIEGQKGYIGLLRLDLVQERGAPVEEQLKIYQDAENSFDEALKSLSGHLRGSEVSQGPEANRAEIQAHLGSLHRIAGHPDLALPQYNEALKLYEAIEKPAQATEVRFNIALTLADLERFGEALEYAREILRLLEDKGADPAGQEIQNCQQLTSWLEQQIGENP